MLKSKVKKNCILVALTILYILIQMLEEYLGAKRLYTFNGILMTVQFGLCFFLVVTDFRRGRIIGQICLCLSLLLLLKVFVLSHVFTPLPGFLSTIIYMVTIGVLARQYERYEKENTTNYSIGLLNERGLHRIISQKVEQEKTFYLIGINIQNYSVITANYSHAYGKLFLKLIASELVEIMDGKGEVALINGKEFFIAMSEEAYNSGIPAAIVNKLKEKKSIHVNDNEAEVYLSFTIGYSKFPDDTTNPETLIIYSEIAMSHAEKTNSIDFAHYELSMEDTLNRQMEIEKLIKSSIKHDYFYLVYQPQYELNGKKLRGFETLIRLNTPDGKVVSPSEFIPVAENKELIYKIDDYVVVRAMKEFCNVVKNVKKDLIISVNISAKNISSVDFPEKLATYLKETGFPPQNLEVELTEYCLIQSIDNAIQNIKELRNMGVKVALDDFGTGYNSLFYLAKMPVSLLKIDKCLIDDIVKDDKILEFVNTIISLGHLMNCEVISEGVENDIQLSLLREKNCDLIQGYVWGKPLAYESAVQLTSE